MRLLVAMLLLIAGGHAARAGGPPSIEVDARPAETTVRVTLPRPFPGPARLLALADPPRLAVDLPGGSAARGAAAGGGLLKAVRVAQFDPQTVRLVLDLAGPADLVSARRLGPASLELRLRPAPAPAFAKRVQRGGQPLVLEPAPAAGGQAPPAALVDLAEIERLLAEEDMQLAAAAAAEASANPRRARGRRPLVVIDPGHGGRDTGAVSVHGRYEKDFTLAVALEARRAIAERGGIDVRLTRTDDRFLTLAERVRIAREAGADLFLSIHADSAPNALARGASVYTLSEVASDQEAARLARRENQADMPLGLDLSGASTETVPILVDLGKRQALNASAEFAQLLQRHLAARAIGFRSEFHRFAGFQVLRNLSVPAVLLEAGFLSNAEDSRMLFEPETRARLAEGIADAVRAWLLP